MLEFVRRLSLNAKFLLFSGIVLILIFSVLASIIYSNQKDEFIEVADNRMYSQLEDLTTLLEIEYKYKQETIDKALRVATNGFYSRGELTEIRDKTSFTAINQITSAKKLLEIPRWNIGEISLQNDLTLVDTLRKLTDSDISIYQKTSEGYMRITTTEKASDGKPLIGYFLPASSPVVQAIERGQAFKGRFYNVNDWYITAFEPIKLEGQIVGMIYTGIKEKDLGYLRKKFKEKKYFTTGYPFALTLKEGQYIIHPIIEGKFEGKANLDEKANIQTDTDNNDKFLDYVRKNKRGKYRFQTTEEDGKTWKQTYFTYYEPYDLVIGATIDETQLLDKSLADIRNTLIIGFVMASLVFVLGLGFIVNAITKVIIRVKETLENIAEGKKTSKLRIESNDEVGQMASSVNTLIDGFNNYASFAEQVGHGNLQAEFKALSKEDLLGNALLDMQTSLTVVAEEEYRRSWVNNGITLFSELLRENNDDIQQLTYEIIANVVKYVSANQGGIFILNDNQDTENAQLDMLACYAYDQRKMLKKQVVVGEGLLGQAFREADTLNIKEIPKSYINITSGLGEATPNNILIVPLKTNGNTLGVIELASFSEFTELQVDFVQRVSDSIAITIFSVKNNLKTKELLAESRELTQTMRLQEEQTRQNVEELQTTQEEMNRSEKETKRMVIELQEKQNTLNALIDNTEDIILSLDKEYRIMTYNVAAKNWFAQENGVKLSYGSNLLSLLSGEQINKFKANFDRALRGERFEVVEVIIKNQDTKIYYEYNFNPIMDKNSTINGLSMFAHNITLRKEQEMEIKAIYEQMSKQEEMISQNLEMLAIQQEDMEKNQIEIQNQLVAINNSSVIRVEISVNGNIESVNNAFKAAFQYDNEDILNKNYKILLSEQEAETPEYANIWKNLRIGQNVTGLFKRKNKYNEDVWLSTSYLPLFDAKKKVYKIIELSFDETITELHKRTQTRKIEELTKENAQLRSK